MTNSTLALWLIVGLAASILGVLIATMAHRPAGYWIKRSRCPNCKSRKSLQFDPVTPSAVRVICNRCTAQFLIQNEDGLPIVQDAAPPAAPGKLILRWDKITLNPIFETDLGTLEFDLTALRDPTPTATEPRQLLLELWSKDIKPVRLVYYGDDVGSFNSFSVQYRKIVLATTRGPVA